MTRFACVLASGWAMLSLAGCAEQGPAGWNHIDDAEYAVARGDVVASAGDFSIVLGEETDGGTAPSTCVQTLVRGIAASTCRGYAAGSHEVAWQRTDDLRYVEVVSALDEVRLFMVWSNQSPAGRSVEPLVAGNHRLLLWPMSKGEQPWGVQAVDGAGRLVNSWSLPELPED